ncbi:VanZ family protein [Arthrobacter sp.]|uniref:VanZ family protein n=1 Tax=Arthrobacter sp. TaxID=1667 RepID=UPI00289AA298|nr:VanZ family protein [Arthrobacter sp.]
MDRPERGTKSRLRPWLAAASALYFGALSAIVFAPSPVDRGGAGAALQRFLDLLHTAGIPRWVDYGLVEAAANVVLFVPLGLLVGAWLSPRWTWLAALAGFCLSAGVETGQALLLPERFATPQDVMANTLGAALGTVAVYAFNTGRKRPESGAEL